MAKTKTIENLFAYLALYSSFFPILFFFIFWKKNKIHSDLRIVVLYCFLIDFLLNYLIGFVEDYKVSQLLYTSFTIFEFLFFAFFLYLNIKKASVKKLLILASGAFILFNAIYFIISEFHGIDSVPIGVETILLLGFSFYYLFEQMNDTTNLFIYTKYQFWVIIGILLYLAGSFFIYIFASQLKTEEIASYWIFTNIFSIIKNALFVIAILVNVNKSQEKKHPFSMYQLN